MHAEMRLLKVLQVHGVFLLIALFSNTLQNAQLQNPTANHKIRRLLLLLKNWKFSLLSCMRGKLQQKVTYLYMISGLKDEAYHYTKALCIKTESLKFSFLYFDIKSNRSQRLQTDKFALFSKVWNRFIDNCYTSYKPGAFITVDEQLFSSKARSFFTQCMASKPDKFGH